MTDSIATLAFSYHEGDKTKTHTEDIVIHSNGPCLWPEWMDLAELKKKRRGMGGPRFEGVYNGNPVSASGAMMNPEWIKDGRPKREDLYTIVQFWDLAWSNKTKSDYVVGLTLGIDNEQNAYIMDIWRGMGMGNSALIDLWAQQYEKWHPSQVGVEVSSGLSGLMSDAMSRHMMPLVTRHPQHTNKVERFQLPCSRAQAGKLYADKALEWWPAAEAELLAFPNGRHDDVCDALSWAMDLVKFVGRAVDAPQPYAFVSKAGRNEKTEWFRNKVVRSPVGTSA